MLKQYNMSWREPQLERSMSNSKAEWLIDANEWRIVQVIVAVL